MHVCIYIYIYTYVDIYICIHVYLFMYKVHTYIYIYTYIWVADGKHHIQGTALKFTCSEALGVLQSGWLFKPINGRLE